MSVHPAAAVRNGLLQRQKRRSWLLVMILILVTCSTLALVLSGQFEEGMPLQVPVALHSALQADYSADPLGMRQPAVLLRLIEDAIQDDSAADGVARFATLESALKTPVASVTPPPGSTPSVAQPTTPTPAAATATPALPASPTASPLPGRTATLTATQTAWPTYTPTPTRPLPTRTPQAQPTSTRKPRPQATATQPAPPKPTQPPPTQPLPTRPPSKDPYPPPEPTQPPYP
jgi:hypothetical protein